MRDFLWAMGALLIIVITMCTAAMIIAGTIQLGQLWFG